MTLLWLYLRNQKHFKQYTYLLTVPFLTITLLLDVLAAKDSLPDSLKVRTKEILIY
jgi:preprotein translocase subunit SecG